MSFMYNKQCEEYFEQAIGEGYTTSDHLSPLRKTKTPLKGIQPRIWRWFYRRMELTSQQFGTITHKEIADGVKDKGWKVIEYRQPSMSPPREYLWRMFAESIQENIPQLSHRTQISKHIVRYPQPIQCHKHEQFEFDLDANAPISPAVMSVPVMTYQIEWQQFGMQVQSDRFYGEMDYYVVAVAYDAFNDCLYVDYKR